MRTVASKAPKRCRYEAEYVPAAPKGTSARPLGFEDTLTRSAARLRSAQYYSEPLKKQCMRLKTRTSARFGTCLGPAKPEPFGQEAVGTRSAPSRTGMPSDWHIREASAGCQGTVSRSATVTSEWSLTNEPRVA